MQFKHPEILYALFLLIIPILVHLFQWRKFQRIEFTNVKFLKHITLQTRKSSRLKKWLTLITRLLLMAALIIAFAQPFFSKTKVFNTKNETVIYLDNSYSMQAKGSNGSLLKSAIQDIIKEMPEDKEFTLFTNSHQFSNTSIKAIQNELLSLPYAATQLPYETVFLKGRNLFSKTKSIKNLVVISDFQNKGNPITVPEDKSTTVTLMPLKPTNTDNSSIDSVYISGRTTDALNLSVVIKNLGNTSKTLPVSLYNDQQLMAKTLLDINDTNEVVFTLPIDKSINGTVKINDNGLPYDNTFYFNTLNREHINVLSIDGDDSSFLRKTYTIDEFNYTSFPLKELNYNLIATQHLIILNAIEEIPLTLNTALQDFVKQGGVLFVLPSFAANIDSYNQLFSNLEMPRFSRLNTQKKRITGINFSHPILTNVFEKKVSNFEYPKVSSFFETTAIGESSILKFEDESAFLYQTNSNVVSTASIQPKNSNFKNSPLIVPILYNIGRQSFKQPELYYTVGQINTIDINVQLAQDAILTLLNDGKSSIPLQQTYTNKVAITTQEYPQQAGIISVKNKEEPLKYLSFNYNRNESNMSYYNLEDIKNASIGSSIKSVVSQIKNDVNVNELWKWFVIFAIVLLIIEILILKYIK